jgi:hypothetical protein
MPVITATVGSVKKKDQGPGQPGQKARPYLQHNRREKAGAMAQAVKHLPSKCKALSSNPSTTIPTKKESWVRGTEGRLCFLGIMM